MSYLIILYSYLGLHHKFICKFHLESVHIFLQSIYGKRSTKKSNIDRCGKNVFSMATNALDQKI